MHLILRAQTNSEIIRVIGVGREFEFIPCEGIDADPCRTRNNARARAECRSAQAYLCVKFIAAADVINAKRGVHPLRFAYVEIEVRPPVVRLAAVHGVDLRRDLYAPESSHQPVCLVGHRTCVVDEGARVLLRLHISGHRLDPLGNARDAS